MEEIAFWLSLILKVFTVYFACIAVFTLKKRRRYPKAAPATRFAVVVAARNEEAVIGNLVESVLNQNYPAHLRDIYVVPNNCTDYTEAAAVAAGAKIIHCLGSVKGKGDALHQALGQLMRQDYDAFVVFDADNVLNRDFLARMNDAFVSGARVCKSRMMAANPTQSGISGCYGLYFAAFDWSFNRPRAALGLSCKLVGTGFAVHREVLEALGGWNTSTIAEDAEFSAQCARLGYRVHWVYDALAYDEAPTSFLLSLRQRKRWCSGVMQVARQELGKLWEDYSPRPMLRWDMTMFLLAPFSQAVSGILLGVNAALHLSSLLSMVPLVLLGLCLAYTGTAALGAALCLLGGYGLRGMGKTVLVFPIFMASWLPLQVISLFRDTKKWHAIQHTGRQMAAGYRA